VEVTFQIRDELAGCVADISDLSRRALEELWAGRITEPQLGEMLGLARIQRDGFLKSHGIYKDATMEDVGRDIADLKACLGA
jgi:hypothetical protein